MVKIIYLTGIFLMLTLSIMSQETVSIPQKQRAAASYITDTIDNEILYIEMEFLLITVLLVQLN